MDVVHRPGSYSQRRPPVGISGVHSLSPYGSGHACTPCSLPLNSEGEETQHDRCPVRLQESTAGQNTDSSRAILKGRDRDYAITCSAFLRRGGQLGFTRISGLGKRTVQTRANDGPSGVSGQHRVLGQGDRALREQRLPLLVRRPSGVNHTTREPKGVLARGGQTGRLRARRGGRCSTMPSSKGRRQQLELKATEPSAKRSAIVLPRSPMRNPPV